MSSEHGTFQSYGRQRNTLYKATGSIIRVPLCSFAWAVLTKCYRPGVLNNRNEFPPTVLDSSSRSRY